jgi:plasmid stabilization system protein ParE
MSRYRFTAQASDDLFEIWSYIARDNVESANRLEDEVYKVCAFLAETPLCGSIRQDITHLPLRFWTIQSFPNYIVVYDPESIPLQVIRILHARRGLLAILSEAHP